jgi:hypothetical protein
MATIDIRKNSSPDIDVIMFYDEDAYSDHVAAFKLLRLGGGVVGISDGDVFVQMLDGEHIQNLILALQKAIELGWTK